MKKFRSILLSLALLQTGIAPFHCHAVLGKEKTAKALDMMYIIHCQQPSDINEHVPNLRRLAKECSSVMELGVRSMVSTWGILKGLSESPSRTRSYIGVDLSLPPAETLAEAKKLAEGNEIAFQFLQANDMTIEIEPVDLLFIDSLHTYCHLTYELETFSPKVIKYIALHDTSEPWSSRDDHFYNGDYSEYPSHYDKSKRGLWPAVVDFLNNHPEWKIHERHYNNHGFTVLKRQ